MTIPADEEETTPTYAFHLPVYKQGDDLVSLVESAKGDLKSALLVQATNYQEAAKLCERLSEFASELTVDGGAHHIIVDGPPELLEALEKRELLHCEPVD